MKLKKKKNLEGLRDYEEAVSFVFFSIKLSSKR